MQYPKICFFTLLLLGITTSYANVSNESVNTRKVSATSVVKNTLSKVSQKNKLAKNEGKADKTPITSTAFNFAKMSQVDPRTGSLSFSLGLGSSSDGLNGVTSTLKLIYNQSGRSIFGTGGKWSLDIARYNVDTGRLYLSGGQVINLNQTRIDGDKYLLRYHKLKDIIVYASKSSSTVEKVIYKNGNTDYFDKNGELHKTCHKNGKCLIYKYDQDKILESITGEISQRALFTIDRNSNSITVINKSLNASFAFHLDSNNGIESITLPDAGVIKFSECNVATCYGMISSIDYPTGEKNEYEYKSIYNINKTKYPVISFKKDTDTTNNSTMTTSYGYNFGLEQHNFLGHNLHSAGSFDPNKDSIYYTPTAYTYITSTQNSVSGISTQRTYNKFHLLILVEKFSQENVKIFEQYYCYNSIGYCASSLSNPTFPGNIDDAKHQYNIPTKIINIHYDIDNDGIYNRETKFSYDEYGNMLSSTDAMGGKKVYTYKPLSDDTSKPDGNFLSYLATETSIPNNGGEVSAVSPEGGAVSVKSLDKSVLYEKVNVGENLTVLKPQEIDYSYTNSNGFKQNWEKNTFDYFTYGDNENNAGLKKESTISLSGSKKHAKESSIRSITTSFNYSNVNTTNVKVSRTSSNVTLSKELNAYSGLTSKSKLDNGSYIQYDYDNMGRKISEKMCSLNEKCREKVTFSYYYKGNMSTPDPSKNTTIATYSNGYSKAISYNALGKQVALYIRISTGSKWVKLTSKEYNGLGYLTKETRYGYNGTSVNQIMKVLSASQAYIYDNEGRKVESKAANGVRNEAVFDVKNNRLISFSIGNKNKTISPISVTSKNKNNLVVDQYILSIDPIDYKETKIITALRALKAAVLTSNEPAQINETLRKAVKTFSRLATEEPYSKISNTYNNLNQITKTCNSYKVSTDCDFATNYTYTTQGNIYENSDSSGLSIIYGIERLLGKINEIDVN